MKGFEKTTVKFYDPLWVKVDFTTYSEQYENIRKKMKRQMVTCFKCGKHFEYGDVVGLACFKDHGNETLCSDCAHELAEIQPPIKIGSDGRCTCHCGMRCPLGKIGSQYRCSKEELVAAGVEIL